MDLALWKTWMNGMAGPGKFWKEKGKIGLKRQAGAISSESEGLSRSTGILTFSFYRKFWPKTWFGKMRPKEGTWKMPADSPKLLSSSSHPVINAGRGSPTLSSTQGEAQDGVQERDSVIEVSAEE